MKSFGWILVVVALSMATVAFGQIQLPAVISSHMVLQRDSEAPIWGWAKPGDQISIKTSWDQMVYGTLTDKDSKWMIKVKTPGAGGPYTIEIGGKDKIVLEDIMCGEVWLCSGQSNMEMPLRGWPEWGGPIEGSEEAIKEANYPEIRLFTVQKATSFLPVDTCSGSWAACTPETAKDFSATGYFFGLQLYRTLGVPVGLIHSSWGGTAAEAWTSSEYISRIPKFATSTGVCDPEIFFKKSVENYYDAMGQWVHSIGYDVEDPGPAWTRTPASWQGWTDIAVPAEWSKTFIGTYIGAVEYQTTFKVPKSWTNQVTVLELGPIDELDIAWVNGKLVGSHLNPGDYATERVYEIPAGTLKSGDNLLALNVGNTSGLGGFNGKEKAMKIRLKKSKSGGKSLAGTWKARKGPAFGNLPPMPECPNCNYPNTPTMLYNGMIKPIIPFGIKGAIWYQGESNRYDGMLYRQIFSGMIQNWRHDWMEGDFPFYFVQIAPYTYRDTHSTGLLREAQQYVMKTVPNTGMVVTMDIGNLKNIHPGNKQDVGKRLANWALAKDYGFLNKAYTGPVYSGMQKEGAKIRIILDFAFGGLTSFGNDLTCFQIAGNDKVFKPAIALIADKTIVVYSDEVPDPVAVRFGWNSTDVPNLFNVLGLPAAPFRTDNWGQ